MVTVLRHPQGTNFIGRDHKILEAHEQRLDKASALAHSDPNLQQDDDVREASPGTIKTGQDASDPPFRVPPLTAVAGVLIRDWVEGRIPRYPTRTS